MNLFKPYLIVEINDNNFIFLVVEYNENLDFKVILSRKVESLGTEKKRVTDIDAVYKILKENVQQIEKDINFTFKYAFLINDQEDFNCINVSGYKKLGGSQISNEDISYILNNIKKLINDNEQKETLIHIFNSSFVLDNKNLNKLPIGLHGDFYNQQLTSFSLPKNDIKNSKIAFNKCNIEIERILFKPFIKVLNRIKNYNIKDDHFFMIDLGLTKSSISVFENLSFKYYESFNFGTNVVSTDVSKVCALKLDNVFNFFKEINFNQVNKEDENFLSEKFFVGENFRKISLSHIKNISIARIEEIIELIFEKNINIKNLKEGKKSIYFFLEDHNFFKNFENDLKSKISINYSSQFHKNPQNEDINICMSSADLIAKGWEREAIPIIQTKKSIISRIFSKVFH